MVRKVFLAVYAWFLASLRKATSWTLSTSKAMWQAATDAYRSFVRSTLALRADANAFISIGSIKSIVAAVVLGIVVLLIVSELAPTFITAVADLVNAIESNSFNNTTADALRSVFGLLVALGGLFALVAYAFIAYRRQVTRSPRRGKSVDRARLRAGPAPSPLLRALQPEA